MSKRANYLDLVRAGDNLPPTRQQIKTKKYCSAGPIFCIFYRIFSGFFATKPSFSWPGIEARLENVCKYKFSGEFVVKSQNNLISCCANQVVTFVKILIVKR